MENIHLKSLYNLYDKGTDIFEHILFLFSFLLILYLVDPDPESASLMRIRIQIFGPLDSGPDLHSLEMLDPDQQ